MSEDKIAENHVVSLSFQLHDADGTLLESSDQDGPLSYIHGQDQIFPGLQQALEGQSVGYKTEVKASPKDGFGEHDERLVVQVPRTQFDFEPEVGQILNAVNDAGQSAPFQVTEIGDDKVTIDGNHPFAGKHLSFSVEVIGVRAATEEELEHGHAHHDGCDHCGSN